MVLVDLTFVAEFFLDFCYCLLLDFLEFYGFLLLLVVLGMYSDLCCWCHGFKDMKHEKNFIYY